MTRLTHYTLKHPDVFLSVVGAVGGFVLGFAHGGHVGMAFVLAFIWALFALCIAHMSRVRPEYTRHQ